MVQKKEPCLCLCLFISVYVDEFGRCFFGFGLKRIGFVLKILDSVFQEFVQLFLGKFVCLCVQELTLLSTGENGAKCSEIFLKT